MSMTCPKCRSSHITSGAKGFGAGKAAAGLLVAGPVGLAAGAIGKNKTTNSCMECGHRWSPADVYAAKRASEMTPQENFEVFVVILTVVALIVGVFKAGAAYGGWAALLVLVVGFFAACLFMAFFLSSD